MTQSMTALLIFIFCSVLIIYFSWWFSKLWFALPEESPGNRNFPAKAGGKFGNIKTNVGLIY